MPVTKDTAAKYKINVSVQPIKDTTNDTVIFNNPEPVAKQVWLISTQEPLTQREQQLRNVIWSIKRYKEPASQKKITSITKIKSIRPKLTLKQKETPQSLEW